MSTLGEKVQAMEDNKINMSFIIFKDLNEEQNWARLKAKFQKEMTSITCKNQWGKGWFSIQPLFYMKNIGAKYFKIGEKPMKYNTKSIQKWKVEDIVKNMKKKVSFKITCWKADMETIEELDFMKEAFNLKNASFVFEFKNNLRSPVQELQNLKKSPTQVKMEYIELEETDMVGPIHALESSVSSITLSDKGPTKKVKK